jgi:hypothetical protein
VFKIDRSRPWPPDIDLATVRGTLRYIEDEMRRVPQFSRIAAALGDAIRETDKAEAKNPTQLDDGVVTHSRFVPFRRRNRS